jgi:release factor glutamine methyltransferase
LSEALGLAPCDARREAELLAMRAAGISRARLIAEPAYPLERGVAERYWRLVERRAGGEPIAYITGEREFYGLDFEVTAAVLIPRPETELLVDAALERMPVPALCRVLDLGTGSGCISVTLAASRSAARVVGADVSSQALAVAARNAARHGLSNLEWVQGDWFAPVAGRRFDLIVSNPPYIAEHDPHLAQGDLRFEPRAALSGGRDGLQAIRAIVTRAPAHLEPAGWLLLEHGHDQGDAVRALLERHGFSAVFSRNDLAGIRRICAGQLTLSP